MKFATVLLLGLAIAFVECSVSRVRRASDSTTEVCGLALQKDATEDDVKTLKRESRSTKARGKRQIGGGLFSAPLSAAKQGTDLGLDTVKIIGAYANFLKINFDFDLASKLKEAVSSNPILKKMVVINEKGVTCEEVCGQANNGFGTIGICTAKYCTCGANGSEPEKCEDDKLVFDIWEKKCAKPEDTILCSDDE